MKNVDGKENQTRKGVNKNVVREHKAWTIYWCFV